MKVILKQDMDKLGKFGDTVEVSAGYARNYLIPKGLVWPNEEKYSSKIDALKSKMESDREKEKEAALEKAKAIEKASVTVEVEAGEDDKLFGSVTNMDVAEKLKAAEIDVDKKDIDISEPIKKLGVYKVDVKLHPEVKASCKVWVVKK